MQETDFHFDEYLRSYAMPTVGMLKVVKPHNVHAQALKMVRFKSAINFVQNHHVPLSR